MIKFLLSAFFFFGTCHLYAINPPLDGAAVTIPNIEAIPGDQAVIPVTANGLSDIATIRLTIQFSPQVLLAAVPAITNIHPELTGLAFNVIEEKINISWFSPANLANIPAGEKLFDLVFIFCDDFFSCAENETQSPLDFVSPTHINQFIDGSLIPLPAAFINGSVFANPPLHILTMAVEGEGSLMVNGDPYTDPLVDFQESTFLLEALPAEEWIFQHWEANGEVVSADNPFLFGLLENSHITAIFEQVLTYMVSFDITDADDNTVANAVVTLNGIENSPGDYIFYDLFPGTYSYSVSLDCHITGEGLLTISDHDHAEHVQLFTLPGDANGDGVLSIADVVKVAVFLSGANPDNFCFENADLNGDGIISVADIVLLVNLLLTGR